jgi:hypothetical protein
LPGGDCCCCQEFEREQVLWSASRASGSGRLHCSRIPPSPWLASSLPPGRLQLLADSSLPAAAGFFPPGRAPPRSSLWPEARGSSRSFRAASSLTPGVAGSSNWSSSWLGLAVELELGIGGIRLGAPPDVAAARPLKTQVAAPVKKPPVAPPIRPPGAAPRP